VRWATAPAHLIPPFGVISHAFGWLAEQDGERKVVMKAVLASSVLRAASCCEGVRHREAHCRLTGFLIVTKLTSSATLLWLRCWECDGVLLCSPSSPLVTASCFLGLQELQACLKILGLFSFLLFLVLGIEVSPNASMLARQVLYHLRSAHTQP
jgi:hypothetical protein